MSAEIVEQDEKQCLLCEKVLAGVGILIAAAFLYISIDVLTDGGLTRAMGIGGVPTDEEVEE